LLKLSGATLAMLLLANRRSLREGLRYLFDLWRWQPTPIHPLEPNGPFAICYDLVGKPNAERAQIITTTLQQQGLRVTPIPVPGEALPNLFVRLGGPGPLRLFVAHYDLSRETPSYQGACDNTAAVAALLAATSNLAANPPIRPIGVLFTSAEERGMLGAQAYVAWAQHTKQKIEAAINFDMIGRGHLASRPSALPGIYCWLPLVGELAFDGRTFRRGQPYPQPHPSLLRMIRRAAPGLVEYRRFTARSDSNIFQDAGIPTIAISSSDMAYLDRVWERDSDRIELLDQTNLERARALILALSRS
jgi:hypothetical protein